MDYVTPTEAEPYHPLVLSTPERMVNVPTAWDGVERVLQDIVERFCPSRYAALEFGVQHGYSTVAISNFFAHVTAVDTCVGDPYAGVHENIFDHVTRELAPFPNIKLICSTWEDWAAKNNDAQFDLIHVDIFHTWEQTYNCGLWACEHSPCVIFHDTIAFPAVELAVGHLATLTGRKYYNWEFQHGLGILVRQ